MQATFPIEELHPTGAMIRLEPIDESRSGYSNENLLDGECGQTARHIASGGGTRLKSSLVRFRFRA